MGPPLPRPLLPLPRSALEGLLPLLRVLRMVVMTKWVALAAAPVLVELHPLLPLFSLLFPPGPVTAAATCMTRRRKWPRSCLPGGTAAAVR